MACIFLSHGRQFWSDELFGWMVARDPSFHHMLYAWRSGADGGGIVFYLAARVWMLCFGESALALRLFTGFCVWVALALTWMTARRWYRLEIVAACLPFLWFTAHSVLRQLMIGRFYGMLMAATAAAVYCYAIAAESVEANPWLLAAVFATNCVLVGTHPFGLLYSGLLLTAMIAGDVARRAWRPRFYFAVLASWWILWPSRFAMHASAAVTKPHFWTVTPTLGDLVDALVFWTDEIEGLWAFLLVVCIAYATFRFKRKRAAYDVADLSAGIAGGALMASILVVYLLSLHGTSYFVDRYLFPSVIGAAMLLCGVLERLVPPNRSAWLTRCLAAVVLSIGAGSVYSFFVDIPSYGEPPHRYTNEMAALLPHTLPVVERVDIFAEAAAAHPDIQWRYLLDWETATSPDSPRGDVSGYHEMEGWQRAGYHADAIQQSSAFLDGQTDFWVVADPFELWFTRRVLNNPKFQVQKMGSFSREHTAESVWYVHRSQAGTSQL